MGGRDVMFVKGMLLFVMIAVTRVPLAPLFILLLLGLHIDIRACCE